MKNDICKLIEALKVDNNLLCAVQYVERESFRIYIR